MKIIHVIIFSVVIAIILAGLPACQANIETKTVTVTSPPTTLTTTSYSTTTTTITTTLEISHISESLAIVIASSIIPPDYRLLASVSAYFEEEQGQNGVWLVNLYKLNITREELEQFGWQEGDNVSFGVYSPGTNEYYGVLVYIDGKTGEIISQEAIWVWLGPPLSVVP